VQPIACAGVLSELAGGSFRNSHRASSGDTFRAGTPARSHSGGGLAKGAAIVSWPPVIWLAGLEGRVSGNGWLACTWLKGVPKG
jgi:hypothetical protein